MCRNKASKARREILVNTITLDSLWRRLGNPRVKMIKIDVEGSEPLALIGGKEFFKSSALEFVLIEINDWCFERVGISYERCFEMLIDYGFSYIYFPTAEGYIQVDRNEVGWPKNKTFLFARKFLSFN